MLADTERQIQVAQERLAKTAMAASNQRGGPLGMVSTAGNAARQLAAAAAMDPTNQAAVGSMRANIEGGAGGALTDLKVKGAGVDASILAQLSGLDWDKATKMADMELTRSQMLAGFANNMQKSSSPDYSGIGWFLGMMGGPGSGLSPQQNAWYGANQGNLATMGANTALSSMGLPGFGYS